MTDPLPSSFGAPPEPGDPAAWHLGPWCVQPLNRMLVGPQGAVRVDPVLMDLLGVLAETPGVGVRREALMARVWPGAVVGEDALNQAVSRLRRALGDDPRRPTYIETIPRVGYRLIVPVSAVTEPPAPLASTVGATGRSPLHPADPRPARPARWGRRVRWAVALACVAGLAALAATQGDGAAPPERAPVVVVEQALAEDPQTVVTLRPGQAPEVIRLDSLRWPEGAAAPGAEGGSLMRASAVPSSPGKVVQDPR
jgi:DNA-binding winged helix-turn-helix (wHTH) protein